MFFKGFSFIEKKIWFIVRGFVSISPKSYFWCIYHSVYFLITYSWICHHGDNDTGLFHPDPTVTWKKNPLKEVILNNVKYHQKNYVTLLWMNCFLIHRQRQCFVGIKVEIGPQYPDSLWACGVWQNPSMDSLNIFHS